METTIFSFRSFEELAATALPVETEEELEGAWNAFLELYNDEDEEEDGE